MIIMGIDPGIALMGFSLVEKAGSRINLIDFGVIETSKSLADPQRLLCIYEELCLLLEKYSPEELAVESLYFTNNQKTAFQVGQARGVVLLTGAQKGIPVFSYTPNEIKVAVTGYGRAGKKQVQEMVMRLTGLKEVPKPDDAADAVAAGICHLYSRKIKVLK